MNENINIDLILERAMKAFDCNTQKQLADLFGISAENFSAKKKRGTLIKLIEKEAFRRNKSYDWIKTGQGEMISEKNVVADNHDSYGTKTDKKTDPAGSSDLNVKLLFKIIEEQNKRIEEQGKRIDEQGQRISEQGKRIDDAIKITEKSSLEQRTMWERINSMQTVLDTYHVKMKRAAESGDLKVLGE